MIDLSPDERKRLENVEGFVFDIQRYSVHDGPGLRTNVFLKGCPLHCGWCANPESQQMHPELTLSEQRCITCGQFETPCPICWPDRADPRQAAEFHQRTLICPTGAVHWIGQRRTAGEVMQEVRRDVPFYSEGGGMTLTGGEVTMQPDMAEALLRLAAAEGISTAMETCGYTRWPVLARLVPFLDDILFDLKHVDGDIHRYHTGVDNTLILDNLRRLVEEHAPVTVRVPLIPGFNASVEAMEAIAQFLMALNGAAIKGVDVLPYHTLGQAKYAALGRDYPWRDHQRLTEAEVTTLVEVFNAHRLPVTVGG